MGDTRFGFESELLISVRPVMITAMILDFIFILTINPLLTSAEQIRELIPWVIIFVVLVTAVEMENRNPTVNRWLTIFSSVGIIFMASYRWGSPALMGLMIIPVTLTAALINISGAIATTIAVTLIMVSSLQFFPQSEKGIVIVSYLALNWIMLGILREIYGRINNVSKWTWERYNHAFAVMREAQDSRVRLGQALDDLVHANRQLALFNRRISEYRIIAEEALQAKSDFVARVSHEFRTPLNIIIGLVELMVETPEIYDVMPSPEMHSDLEVIYRNSEHLSKMINDILDLTRTEVGFLTIHRERQDLYKIIESAMIAVRPLLENKKLNWSISVPENLSEVYCDGIRIEQVILNLVSNAVRYTDQGGISVEVTQKDQHIKLSVIDTGSGISPEDVDRIFEPFTQSTSQLWRDKGGSGLGLSISKQIVELHGGRMWVKSQLGVGSTFTFELPINSPIQPVIRPGYQIMQDLVWSERNSRYQFPNSHYKPRMVIFDETGTLYNLLTHVSDEVEFVSARDLGQVSDALQQSPAHAIIINLLSHEMVSQSIEMVKQKAPGTPIIACSVPPEIDQIKTYGVLGYLIKPVTRSDLICSIQAIGKPIRRVLVVDDDPTVQEIFHRMLTLYDSTLEITTVSNGSQALIALRQEIPDLLLLDIVMPGMDGWQVLKAIRQDKNIGEVPTLVVSAQDPRGKPPSSAYLIATMDKELSLSKLLNCSLDLSALLLKPEGIPGLTPVETV